MFPALYNRKKKKPFEFIRNEWVWEDVPGTELKGGGVGRK